MSTASAKLNAVSLWTPEPAPAEIIEPGPRFGWPCLADVIDAYQADPLSSFHKQRFHVRKNHRSLLRRIRDRHGRTPLASITGRTLVEWHADWMGGTKVAIAHSFIAQLRTVFGFGFTLLSDPQSERLSHVLSKMRFPMATGGDARMTVEQADAVRMWAHIIGWHSIGMAQAVAFEGIARQKDVIGEFVPLEEPGASNIVWREQKWLRGLRWNEIDDNLILRHVTSKKQKPIEVDLKLCPMVMDELQFANEPVTDDEPLIICESTGMPYSDSEFRRKWRIAANYAGVPHSVKNMHSRHGGISEAFEAGVDGSFIQKAATHSDARMTNKYNRGAQRDASDKVQIGRVSSRRTLDADTRDARWHQAQTMPVKATSKRRAGDAA